MKTLRRILAALMLLAWLSAGVHAAVEHGGPALGAHRGEMELDHHSNGPDRDLPSPDGDGHHHDIRGITSRHLTLGCKDLVSMPESVVLHESVFMRLAAVLALEAGEQADSRGVVHPPSDERLSGWLFVVTTALRVRGPSFVV